MGKYVLTGVPQALALRSSNSCWTGAMTLLSLTLKMVITSRIWAIQQPVKPSLTR